MKRVIFGILVLIGCWGFFQIPPVNAAFYAFLTLGINPLTNHPFSTVSLLSVLFAIGIAVMLILFSQAFNDFFGGLVDWLTGAEHAYRAEEDAAAPPSIPLSPISSPGGNDGQPTGAAMSSSAVFADFIAPLRNIQLLTAPTTRLRRFGSWLTRTVNSLPRYQSKTSTPGEEVYNKDLAPELAEVLAIFEQIDRDATAAEPQEAVIVEKPEPKAPNAGVLLVRRQLALLAGFASVTKRTAASQAMDTSSFATKIARATEDRAAQAARRGFRTVAGWMAVLYRLVYRSALLVLLGCLLGGEKLVSFGRSGMVRIRRGSVSAAIMITLAMFAIGRSVQTLFRAIMYGLTAVCRGTYWVLANLVMLCLLGAGYTLFIVSLVSFMIWDVCEPYARKLDKWLEDTLEGNKEFAEVAKMGREMSRTFTQWYRELRHSYRS